MKRTSSPSFLAVLLVAGVLALGCGGVAVAQSNDGTDAVRARVDTLLDGIEYAPDAAEWTALGPDAAAVLITIASDESVLATRRARAVTALAQFPGEATVASARALLARPDAPVIVRRKAIATLAAVDAEALTVVQPFLSHEEIQLRESAALAIAALGTPAARQALELRLALEPSEHVKQVIATGLAR